MSILWDRISSFFSEIIYENFYTSTDITEAQDDYDLFSVYNEKPAQNKKVTISNKVGKL